MCRGSLLLLAATLTIAAAAHAQGNDPVTPDVSGTWAEQQVLAEFATLPLVGEVPRVSTIVLRASITQSGSSLGLRATYCATDIDNGSPLATTVIPDAFLASLGEVAAAASLDETGRFAQPWTVEVRGARLADPDRDALPTRAGDPRVVDQDRDGRPGLTVHVSALGLVRGDVYVVQRIRSRLTGALVAPGRIEGLFECTTEQVVIGATSPLFLSDLPSRPDPVAEKSAFVFVRIDPAWTCADILARREVLFGL